MGGSAVVALFFAVAMARVCIKGVHQDERRRRFDARIDARLEGGEPDTGRHPPDRASNNQHGVAGAFDHKSPVSLNLTDQTLSYMVEACHGHGVKTGGTRFCRRRPA